MIKNFQNLVMRASKGLVSCTLLTLSLSAMAQDSQSDTLSLTPYKATYTAYKWDDDVGEASIELSKLGNNQYSLLYTSKVSKFFLSDKRSEHSIFTVNDNTVVPSQYFYDRSGTGPDKALKVTFSHQGNGKINVENGNTFDWNGEFDNQIYRLDLAKQLAEGKTSLSYDFVNYRGELRHYGVEVVDNETLSLPYGKIEAVKVKLIRDSKKRETFAWFAPSLNYALVRLQQFKEGDEQGDIKLKSFTEL
ncbi:DUF3108 domain-containing protein [Alteromonas sp. McT4-15]|uniref:DUF3108 domain-containing protein n=1 Tax=Alteromonas sp. McT4-15 TaxID=2881256 RepID=UPI0012E41D46|nr:DUF3108 domain-containing protein [Alteromonas sp. McT4-15]MCB4437169.1 DUF3108 domain-containing protein [Alteromonas sp. McT4-15]GFD88885.1 hypothetical protein KUL152_11110 [Tenacibaculum sp. KUL152]